MPNLAGFSRRDTSQQPLELDKPPAVDCRHSLLAHDALRQLALDNPLRYIVLLTSTE